MPETLAIAMSGGVDSSAAACLLLEQGYELVGLTMKLFSRPGDVWHDGEDAQAVARQLGFPHHMVDLSPCFCTQVMDTFAAAYEAGCTPNPCVTCNRHIKFGALLDEAVKLGFEACILPKICLEKMKKNDKIKLYGVSSLREAIALL